MIDQAAIKHGNGFTLLPIADWLALPTEEQRRLLEGNLVEFLAKGRVVRPEVALRQLRDAGTVGPRASPATSALPDADLEPA